MVIAHCGLRRSRRRLTRFGMQRRRLRLGSMRDTLCGDHRRTADFTMFLRDHGRVLRGVERVVGRKCGVSRRTLVPRLGGIGTFVDRCRGKSGAGDALLVGIRRGGRRFLRQLSRQRPGLARKRECLTALLQMGLSAGRVSVLAKGIPGAVGVGQCHLHGSLGLSSRSSLASCLRGVWEACVFAIFVGRRFMSVVSLCESLCVGVLRLCL